MAIPLVQRTLLHVERLVNELTSTQQWLWRSFLVITVLIMFFSFPSFWDFNPDESGSTWQAVLKKSADIGYNALDDVAPERNAAKTNFRLTVPVIASLLGLNAYGMYALQICSGLVIFGLALVLTERITGDRTLAFFITLMIGSTYAGRTGYQDLVGRFDAVAIMLLLLAITFDYPVVILLSVFLAAWTDERGLIASSLILVFFVIRASREGTNLFKVARSSKVLAVILGWVAYFVTRFAYAAYYDMPTPSADTGLGIFRDQLNMWPMGVWTAFEGGWILVGLCLLILFQQKRYIPLLLFAGSLTVILVVALSVLDVSRSMAFALPAIFIALDTIAHSEDKSHLKLIIYMSVFLTVLWPAYWIERASSIWWTFPLPIQIYRWVVLCLI